MNQPNSHDAAVPNEIEADKAEITLLDTVAETETCTRRDYEIETACGYCYAQYALYKHDDCPAVDPVNPDQKRQRQEVVPVSETKFTASVWWHRRLF